MAIKMLILVKCVRVSGQNLDTHIINLTIRRRND